MTTGQPRTDLRKVKAGLINDRLAEARNEMKEEEKKMEERGKRQKTGTECCLRGKKKNGRWTMQSGEMTKLMVWKEKVIDYWHSE